MAARLAMGAPSRLGTALSLWAAEATLALCAYATALDGAGTGTAAGDAKSATWEDFLGRSQTFWVISLVSAGTIILLFVLAVACSRKKKAGGSCPQESSASEAEGTTSSEEVHAQFGHGRPQAKLQDVGQAAGFPAPGAGHGPAVVSAAPAGVGLPKLVPELPVHWKRKQARKLVACIVMDGFGDASLLIPPPFGELTDIVYAPVYAFTVYAMFGSRTLAVLAFLKELCPFTDLVPLCTICWIMETFCSHRRVVANLGITHPVHHPYEGGLRGPGPEDRVVQRPGAAAASTA